MDIKDIPTLLNEEKESLVHFNNIDGSQIIDTFGTIIYTCYM